MWHVTVENHPPICVRSRNEAAHVVRRIHTDTVFTLLRMQIKKESKETGWVRWFEVCCSLSVAGVYFEVLSVSTQALQWPVENTQEWSPVFRLRFDTCFFLLLFFGSKHSGIWSVFFLVNNNHHSDMTDVKRTFFKRTFNNTMCIVTSLVT